MDSPRNFTVLKGKLLIDFDYGPFVKRAELNMTKRPMISMNLLNRPIIPYHT